MIFMDLSNKDIQRLRTMSYFIDGAKEIIDTEGIEAVSVRKVSKLAGYNPATFYNYFDNIDYLVGFAAIKYLRDYHYSLYEVEKIPDAEKKFLAIWEKFAIYSFKQPKIYRALFFNTPKLSICQLLEQYYLMFPTEKSEHELIIEDMMRGCTLLARNLIVLVEVRNKKNLKLDSNMLAAVNEMMILIYRGKLAEVIENDFSDEEKHQAVKDIVNYMRILLEHYK